MISIKRSKQTAILLLILSVLALAAAIISLVDPSIYGDVLDSGIYYNALMPGTLSQDLVSVGAAGLLIVLAFALLHAQKAILMIPALGLAGFFLYGYGTYVISAAYTLLYPLYMAIFSLAIFALILGFSAIDGEQTAKLTLPKWLRIALGVFLLLIVSMFTFLWGSSVLSAASYQERPTFYAIYILDLCFVMPVLAVTAILLFRKKGFGVLLGGVALVKVITLILSVSLAGLFVPIFGGETDGMSPMYIVITAISAVLYALYCLKLRQQD